MLGSSSPAARRRWRGVCCSLILSLSGAARASELPPSAVAENAHERVEALLGKGIQSREAGRDTEALEYYRQAVALEPSNPRVLAHLGATYQALGRWVSAHTYLTQALQFRDDPYIVRHRRDLEEALSTVADHLGFLEIYGAPAGAEALINGQLVARLPMTAPIPVTVGSYLLEVRFEDHYTLGRPITISRRALTREAVELAPHRREAPSTAPATPLTGADTSAAIEERPNETRWLPWALGGLSAVAAATSVVAWERRNHYASRWNDDAACLGVGISRAELCGAELDRGKRAEKVLWISGAAAGALAVGAVFSALWSSDEPRASAGLSCAPGIGGAQCFGSF